MADITMPKMSDTMEEGTIVKWLKHEGDRITECEPIAEIQTDKANIEMEAFESGVLAQILVHEGETVPVGQPIAILETAETAEAPPEQAPQAGAPEITLPSTPEPAIAEQPAVVTAPREELAPTYAEEVNMTKASPLARRLANEYKIDISNIQGTGPNGRVVEADVESYYAQSHAPAAPPKPAPTAPSGERELSRMRKTIAERMTKSKQTVPHFYVTVDIEMDWAAHVRSELNADESQPKVSFTDMIIKACALALAKHPDVNSSFDGAKLLVHKNVNVALAVALDEGLIAPVVHNANEKPLRQIASETKELANRARSNSLLASDYTGGTFTISNLGMFDVENFAAIINPPDAATLAIGSIYETPVVTDGHLEISQRMKVTLSADHRVLDGVVAAKFMQEVKHQLQSPIGLL